MLPCRHLVFVNPTEFYNFKLVYEKLASATKREGRFLKAVPIYQIKHQFLRNKLLLHFLVENLWIQQWN